MKKCKEKLGLRGHINRIICLENDILLMDDIKLLEILLKNNEKVSE